MEKELIFTKEIKNAWLNALKSGKYIQGTGELMNHDKGIKKHCCLGVLCEIHPRLGLDTDDNGMVSFSETLDGERVIKGESWPAIKKLLDISSEDFHELYCTNDSYCDGKYTKVIPLIKSIPTKD